MTSISTDHDVSSRITFKDDPMPWEKHLAPQYVFAHPDDVVAAPYLDVKEKRAILASWASDRFAAWNCPTLRRCPGLKGKHIPVRWIERALASLDRHSTSKSIRIKVREDDLPFIREKGGRAVCPQVPVPAQPAVETEPASSPSGLYFQ